MAGLVKRPTEERTYTFSFAEQPEIEGGDTLTGSPTITQETLSGSGSLTIGAASISGSGVRSEISGGVDESLYKLTCTCNTTAGSILVAKVTMLITSQVGGRVA